VQRELFRLFYNPFSSARINPPASSRCDEEGKGGRLLKREIRAASSRNKVTMQIQTGASRRRKKQTRRQRKQFPWNIPPYEWRPEGWTTSSTRRESLPIVDTFLPRDFLLSSTLIPPPTTSIDLRVLLASSHRSEWMRLKSSSEKTFRYPLPFVNLLPWLLSLLASRFFMYNTAKRFLLVLRNFRDTLRAATLLPGRWKSRIKPQMRLDSWLRQENSIGWSIHRHFHRVHAL